MRMLRLKGYSNFVQLGIIDKWIIQTQIDMTLKLVFFIPYFHLKAHGFNVFELDYEFISRPPSFPAP